MPKKKKKIAVMTGGGDCPGLNAAIRAVVRTAVLDYDIEVIGILDGFEGLIENKTRHLRYDDVSNILNLGGTILGSSNKATLYGEKDLSNRALKNIKNWGIDGLICIGGDGTCSIAARFLKKWHKIICVPKTIDNDLKGTDQTIGFNTAAAFVTDAVDRLHSTAESHHRVMVLEVMGRYAGWLALEGGFAGGGDVILIPEIPFIFDKVVEAIQKRIKKGKKASIIVVAEGAKAVGEKFTVSSVVKDSPDPLRLGGIGKRVSDYIQDKIGIESRVTILGHLQRGGAPNFVDRMLATGFGVEALNLVLKGNFGKMVAIKGREITAVKISDAVKGLRLVNPDSTIVKTALSLGTSFGI